MPRARDALASTASRTPRIVTTRTPLFDEAGWREDGADLEEMRSGLFLQRNLDDPNRFELACEIRSLARRVFGVLDQRPRDRAADLPAGQSPAKMTKAYPGAFFRVAILSSLGFR
jgi:hypothetical protein